VQGKINRGRHTDHPAGCHSIRIKRKNSEDMLSFGQVTASSTWHVFWDTVYM